MNRRYLTQWGQYKKIIGGKLCNRRPPKRIMGIYGKGISLIEKREFLLLRWKHKTTVSLKGNFYTRGKLIIQYIAIQFEFMKMCF